MNSFFFIQQNIIFRPDNFSIHCKVMEVWKREMCVVYDIVMLFLIPISVQSAGRRRGPSMLNRNNAEFVRKMWQPWAPIAMLADSYIPNNGRAYNEHINRGATYFENNLRIARG